VVLRKKVQPNYDYTGKDRVVRQRRALADAGGARVETHLDAAEVAKLDALVKSGVAGASRSIRKSLA